MFDDVSEDESTPNLVKEEKGVGKRCEMVHSSLDYHTIKVPPILEYKSIDNYCEKKGEKFQSASDPSTSSLRSISEPIVLRTPQPPQSNIILPSSGLPFCFFSVEELSLVKALSNWSNERVCAVGMIKYSCNTSEWNLHSVGEIGSWTIEVDLSNLKVNLVPNTMLQVYGILNIHKEKPKIVVCFVRNLRTADLSLFVESYQLMETYVPRSINVPKSVEDME